VGATWQTNLLVGCRDTCASSSNDDRGAGMTGTSSLLARWAWPVKLDGYDRTPELKAHEVEG